MRRRARALSLVACALLAAAQAADASFFDHLILGGSRAGAAAKSDAAANPDAAAAAVVDAEPTPTTQRPAATAAVTAPKPAAAKPKQQQQQQKAPTATQTQTTTTKTTPTKTTPTPTTPTTTMTTTPAPQTMMFYAPPVACGPDKPCPDVAMACCGGTCLDTSRGGVACIDDAPCPSAGVCAAPSASPGQRAAATCCLFPGVCVGGRTCCAARARVCGTKCCPEGYACLAGSCMPAGCQGVKEGMAMALELPAAADKGAAADADTAAAASASSATTTAATTPVRSSRSALVPIPVLPKGLKVQYADEALAAGDADKDAEGDKDDKGAGAEARQRAARPFVRVESPDACCALCAATAGCTSFTHGAVVLAPSAGVGDAAAAAVRTSCELWAEEEETEGPPANSESASRPAGSPSSAPPPPRQLKTLVAPAYVTSGRVPRVVSAGEGGSKPASFAEQQSSPDSSSSSSSSSSNAKSPSRGAGAGLYSGIFDSPFGDYQGSALKHEHDMAQTPCSKASDAVKDGGRGAEALFNAVNPGRAYAPAEAAEAALTLAAYRAAAAELLGGEDRAPLSSLDVPTVAASLAAGAKESSRGNKKARNDHLLLEAGTTKAAASSLRSAPDPCGASLALMTSTWLAGGTVLEASGADGASVGTVRACCELCAATGGCEYWTFSTPLSSCWLRSGSGGGGAPIRLSSDDAPAGTTLVTGAVASQPSGGGPLASVPCRYSISGAMQGAPSPGLCAATLVCRGAPTVALPDGAASCCPTAGWACSSAGVCCPPGSSPCGAQCGCAQGTSCVGGACRVQQAVASVLSPSSSQPQVLSQFQQVQQQQPQSQSIVQAQQPAWQSQLLQFEGRNGPPGVPVAGGGGGGGGGGGANLVFSPNGGGGGGGGGSSSFSADTPRFGYYGRAVIDGAALVTDPSDPQACRQRPAEGAAAFRFGRVIAANSGGALNRNSPVAQATAVDCCIACGGIGNCDAFSWDGTSLACFYWTNKINSVLQQRLETPQKGAVVGDMVRSLSFRADGTPVPRLDDACRAPCGPADGARPALCCVDGRETCLSPSGVGVSGDRHQCCPNASVCGRRCGCDAGSICVAGETCCPGSQVCGGVCCPQGRVCGPSGACEQPRQDPGLVIVNPQPFNYGWNRGGWYGGNNWNGGWNGGGVIPISASRVAFASG